MEELLINEVRVVICDPSTGACVGSAEIEGLSEVEKAFITKKIKKVVSSDEMRKSELKREAIENPFLLDYLNEEIDFEELVEKTSKQYFDYKIEAGKYEAFDFIVVEAKVEGIVYLVFMDCGCKKGFTHFVEYSDEGSVNRIIEYKAIISDGLSKDDQVFAYDIINEVALIKENVVEVLGNKKKMFSELMFPCTLKMSEKEVFASLSDTAKELAMKYQLKSTEVLPALKVAVNQSDDFDVDEIADVIFEERKEIKDDFVRTLKEKGVEKKMDFDNTKLKRKDRVVKFVTENGIEISIPSEFMRRTDKVEIINNPDGTVSIEIKHVNELKNRAM